MNLPSGGGEPAGAGLPAALGTFGLPARDPRGEPPGGDAFSRSLIFFFFFPPSLCSSPVASPSLPDPAPIRLVELRSAAEVAGAGDIGREPTALVDCDEVRPCFFLCFFLEDSVPLASERSGDPGRLRLVAYFFSGSVCFGRPDGVFVPLEEAPEGTLLVSLPLSLSDLSPSFFFSSSSLSLSSSLASSSLWERTNQSWPGYDM